MEEEEENKPVDETDQETAEKRMRESLTAVENVFQDVLKELSGFEHNFKELERGLMKTFTTAISGYVQGIDFPGCSGSWCLS